MRIALRLLVVLALGAGGLALATVAVAPQVGEFFTAGSVVPPEVNLRPLAERSVAYADNGSVLATFHAAENRQEVRLRRIPRTVRRTILAVEDEDFFQHNGFNLRATFRALFENVSAGGIAQGGSTITQQLVKLSLLSPRQDLNRKAREAILAIELEKTMSKQEILERYLNQVYFGGGAYGVQAAAEIYWGQNVEDLDWGQAALLASLIQNPVGYDPVREPDVARQRRRVALDRIVELGYITQEEADYYDVAGLPQARIDVLPEPNDYFVEEVKQQLLDMEELGATPTERYNALFKGGLRIETTFSPEAQFLALSARNNVLPDTGGQFTAAMVAVTPQTGAVRAMVGGPGFDRYRYNLATQGARQPGSSFKIFVLTAALEGGLVLDDTLNGSGPCSFPNPGGYPDPYVANNFAGESGGTNTITGNVQASSNCGFLRLGQFVGLQNVVDVARRMGITTELDARNLSLPIGSEEVHPIDMAGAAAVLANGGIRHRPYFIDRVTDRRGNVIYEHQSPGRQVVSQQSACLATEALEANVQAGTGTAAQLSNMAVAGKTGTAQSFGDAWFVGYTPFLATAVWMGNAEARVPMTNVGGRTVTGGSYPAEIWHAFNEPAHNGLAYTDFPTCEPTRPGRDLARYFDPEPEEPTTTTVDPATPTVTCPAGYLPGDLDGDGVVDSCVAVDTPTTAPAPSTP
ncbi:MAG TPA: transglycosylase domain-containing protein [Acidimicrobiales bacterium]|nr:transglycosylase domain-containing protein [Acidimicrobiales bacterium]